MAFEKGNKYGGRPKLFDAALRRAIAQDDGERIRACAEKLLDLAAAGEMWAVRELADRLDGKATQQLDVSVTDRPNELSDSELLRIASGSSTGTAEPADGKEVSSRLH